MDTLRILLIFTFLCTTLCGSEQKVSRSIEDLPEAPSIVDLQRAPNNVVGGCVNVISGHYFESHDDLVVGGSNPVSITRFFSSGIKGCKELQYFWDLNISGKMNLKKVYPDPLTDDPYEIPNEAESQLFATIVHRGIEMPFEGKFDKPLSLNTKFFKSGVVHECSPYWSGQTHAKNKSLRSTFRDKKKEIFELNSSNLEKSSFSRKTDEKYLLESLRKGDGTYLNYEYGLDLKADRVIAKASDKTTTGFVCINRKKQGSQRKTTPFSLLRQKEFRSRYSLQLRMAQRQKEKRTPGSKKSSRQSLSTDRIWQKKPRQKAFCPHRRRRQTCQTVQLRISQRTNRSSRRSWVQKNLSSR